MRPQSYVFVIFLVISHLVAQKPRSPGRSVLKLIRRGRQGKFSNGFIESSSTILQNGTKVLEGLSIDESISRGHLKFALSVYRAMTNNSERNENIVYSPIMLAQYLLSVLISLELDAFSFESGTSETTGQYPFLDHFRSRISKDKRPRKNNRPINEFGGGSRDLVNQLLIILNLEDTSRGRIATVQQNLQEYLQSLYVKNSLRHCIEHFWHKQKQRISSFRAGVLIDFLSTSNSNKDTINGAMNRCTGGELREVLQNNPKNHWHHLVIAGAILSVTWHQPFNSSLTFDKGLFYTSDNQRLEIPVMVDRKRVPLGYSRELETRVLELPLYRRRASLFILLPDHSKHGLENLEKNLTADTIRNLLATIQDEIVNIRLPKFSIQSTPRLQDALRSLGVTSLFRRGVTAPDTQLMVDDILYKVVFEVDESGRSHENNRSREDHQGHISPENVTASRSSNFTPDIPAISTFGEKHFQVDHPFLFFIWDYFHSYVVVIGKVTHPEPLKQEADLF